MKKFDLFGYWIYINYSSVDKMNLFIDISKVFIFWRLDYSHWKRRGKRVKPQNHGSHIHLQIMLSDIFWTESQFLLIFFSCLEDLIVVFQLKQIQRLEEMMP